MSRWKAALVSPLCQGSCRLGRTKHEGADGRKSNVLHGDDTSPDAATDAGAFADVGEPAGGGDGSLTKHPVEVGTGGKERPGQAARRPQDWSAEEKLRAAVEAAALDGAALGEYLRRRGIHAEHVEQWRAAAVAALEAAGRGGGAGGAERKRIKELERELRKKDAALAETAALLVLRKKPMLSGGDGDDDTDRRNEP
jgi:transposase-like protein